jgi:hypothetical protein
MKTLVLTLSFILTIIVCFSSCKKATLTDNEKLTEQNMTNTNSKIWIKVGEKTFTATLSDSPTTKAFKALLPLTLNMGELNNNEKYAQLPQSIPTNASLPPSIQSGDLMLYGSTTLVLFYKGFSTSYSYTTIGKIDDVTGLVAAVGSDDVKVSFELEKD